MAWTYSGDPASSDRDAVRTYVQDVDSGRQLLTDEVIDWLLAKHLEAYGDVLAVAAIAAEVIAAKFASAVSVSGDGVSVNTEALQGKYEALAKSLRDQYKDLNRNAVPLLTDPLDMAYDPSIPPLTFGVGLFDNPWAGRQDFGDQTARRGIPFELSPGEW